MIVPLQMHFVSFLSVPSLIPLIIAIIAERCHTSCTAHQTRTLHAEIKAKPATVKCFE